MRNDIICMLVTILVDDISSRKIDIDLNELSKKILIPYSAANYRVHQPQ